MINLQRLIDDAKCYAVVQELRWPDGVRCPECGSGTVKKRGYHMHQAYRQRYQCQGCGQQFDDLSGRSWKDIINPCGSGCCVYI